MVALEGTNPDPRAPPGPLRAPRISGRAARGSRGRAAGGSSNLRSGGASGGAGGRAGGKAAALIPAHLALPDPPPAGPASAGARAPSSASAKSWLQMAVLGGGPGGGPGWGPGGGRGRAGVGKAMQGLLRPKPLRFLAGAAVPRRGDAGGCAPTAFGPGTQDTATRPGHPPPIPLTLPQGGTAGARPGEGSPRPRAPRPRGRGARWAERGTAGRRSGLSPRKVAEWTLTQGATRPGSQGPHGGPARPCTAPSGSLQGAGGFSSVSLVPK